MKIHTKILLGYLAISFIFILLGMVLIFTTNTLSPVVSELDEEINKFSDALLIGEIITEIRLSRTELHDLMTDSIIDPKQSNTNEHMLKAKKLERLLDKAIKKSEQAEQESFRNLNDINMKLISKEKDALNLLQENKIKEVKEILSNEKYEDLNTDFFDTLIIISNARKTGSQDVFGSLIRISSSIKINKEKIDTLVKVVLMSIVVVVVLSILLGFFLSRSISKPVQELTKASEELKKGNLDYEVKIKSKDEIGGLAETFDEMRTELKRRSSQDIKDRETLLNSLFEAFKGKFGNVALIVVKKNIKDLIEKNPRIMKIIPKPLADSIKKEKELKEAINKGTGIKKG